MISSEDIPINPCLVITKIMRIFICTNSKIRHNNLLSSEGKEWVSKTLSKLQELMEDILNKDPYI